MGVLTGTPKVKVCVLTEDYKMKVPLSVCTSNCCGLTLLILQDDHAETECRIRYHLIELTTRKGRGPV